MAGNIKGITIEFNGDTTKLDKALREVRGSTKDIDSELKKVNQSLKFNPNNVNMLKQKQELLSQEIKQTESNLKDLKSMQQQVANDPSTGKNSKEYRELEREILKAENQLKRFNAEQKKIKAQLSPLGQFSTKMKAVGNSLEQAGQKMRALSIASAAVVAALSGMAYKAGQTADDINTLSMKYSIGTKELQKYALAAEQVDVDVDTIAKSHVRLEKNMLAAAQGSKNQADAFKAIGVEYKNADGSLRDGDTVWTEMIKKLGQMTNETERDAYAMQLMGRSAAELNPLIEDGGDTYERMAQLFEKYDLDFIDQETLDKANEFNDRIDDIKSIASLTFQTMGAELAGVLLPALSKVVDWVGRIAEWLSNLNPTVLAIVGAIAGVLAVVAPLLIGLGKLAFAISSIAGLAATLGISLGAIAAPVLIVVGVIAALVAAGVLLYKNWDTIKAKAAQLKNWLVGVWESIKKTTVQKFNAIKDAITKPFTTAISIIKTAIDKIKNIINKAKLALPKFKLPHFVISGGKLPWGIGGKGVKPTIDVKWYKDGGIFKSPSVIGVGEKNKEAVVPLLGKEMKPFAEAIAKNINGNGGNTYNFGDIKIEAHDLVDLKTAEDFVRRIMINDMTKAKAFG